MKSYFLSFWLAARTLLKGLRLTFRHLVAARRSPAPMSVRDNGYFDASRTGIATLQYPYQQLPVPDTGRYRLHNEIDDCIVCDKCVKICPVDCITIDAIKSPEAFGRTSDGTPKRIYAARFDIDMGKCCFCGLCTTVCPTECLTMTKVFDFSVFDIKEHYFAFGNMPEAQIREKREEEKRYVEEKQATAESKPATGRPAAARPRFKPPGTAK